MGTLLAFARANAIYWPSVAPVVRRQLRSCERRARRIPDRRLRSLALGQLRRERFNPLLAATLATLAPRRERRRVVGANVALQVAYDYLDALEERGVEVDGRDDGGYARSMLACAYEAFARLPAADAAFPAVEAAAERCRQAQRRAHEALAGDERELERWARAQAAGTGLRWPEMLAGAQASVLCVHALVAAAADPATTPAQAEATDALYLRIGALTMLDGLVDRDEDLARGERGFAARCGGAPTMGLRLAAVVREVAALARRTPHAGHHLMTAAGVVAFYGSSPAASAPGVEPAFAALRDELGPTLVPVAALMRIWRAAARGTLSFRHVTHVAFAAACFWVER